MIVDYQSYATVEAKTYGSYIPVNHAWLRTQDSPAAVASVRTALSTPRLQLENLYDRRALSAVLSGDPLYLNLIGVLIFGMATALLLALVGDLFASWWSVRRRLTQFAVLRAQGATSQQVAGVLTWEQGIVYTTALALGAAFGGLLAITVVPALVFTNIPASGVLSDLSISEFFVIQQSIPSQIVVPLSLGVALGVLIVICVVALSMMVQVALRPTMGQALRLNED